MNESQKRRIRDRASGVATIINEGCRIQGTISGTGNYLVNGEVDGDCELEGTLTLAGGGVWRGTIRATHVIVSGRLEGDIMAAGKVEITQTARICGTVAGDAIAVAEGAIVEGIMKTTGPADPVEFVERRQPNHA